MLFDSHCHLQFHQYDEDRESIMADCKDRGMGLLIVGCDTKSSENAVVLAGSHTNIWATVGIHPTDSAEGFDYKKMKALCASSQKVVAIGETGLDYFHLPKEEQARAEQIHTQKELFLAHIELAHELHLPLVIHSRDAHTDLLEILINRLTTPSAHGSHPQKEFGVAHCFTGSVLEAQSYLDLGFLISFTGILTFTHDYDEVVRAVSLEKILIETDAPFLTPVPYRGKKNSPLYVEYVAKRIADIKGISYEDVVRATAENTKRLFKV